MEVPGVVDEGSVTSDCLRVKRVLSELAGALTCAKPLDHIRQWIKGQQHALCLYDRMFS